MSQSSRMYLDQLEEFLVVLRRNGVMSFQGGFYFEDIAGTQVFQDVELDLGPPPLPDVPAARLAGADPETEEDKQVDPADGLTKKQKRELYGG